MTGPETENALRALGALIEAGPIRVRLRCRDPRAPGRDAVYEGTPFMLSIGIGPDDDWVSLATHGDDFRVLLSSVRWIEVRGGALDAARAEGRAASGAGP